MADTRDAIARDFLIEGGPGVAVAALGILPLIDGQAYVALAYALIGVTWVKLAMQRSEQRLADTAAATATCEHCGRQRYTFERCQHCGHVHWRD